MRAKRLTAQQKKEIFHALVTAQDLGLMTVSQSVQQVSKQFEITEAQLRQIEDEGIDAEWPPLNEPAQILG
jgi:DNA-directed RNA polymerase sigma subunit (sigma70/sigma32)